MGDQHQHGGATCKCQPTAAVQSLDEMEFERGIWTAALYNDTDRMSELIRRGDTDRRDSYGYTALHYAARKNHYDACVMLIRAGADVNACTNGGASPLHRAAMMGCDRIVRLLLDSGAKLPHQDHDGNNVLHRAASNGCLEIAKILMKADESLNTVTNTKGQRPYDLVPAHFPELQSFLGVQNRSSSSPSS